MSTCRISYRETHPAGDHDERPFNALRQRLLHLRAKVANGPRKEVGDSRGVTFDDPAGDHDWGISAEVDLAASDEAGIAVVRVTAVGQL